MCFHGKLVGLKILLCKDAFYFTERGKGFVYMPWEPQNTKRVGTSLKTEQQ